MKRYLSLLFVPLFDTFRLLKLHSLKKCGSLFILSLIHVAVVSELILLRQRIESKQVSSNFMKAGLDSSLSFLLSCLILHQTSELRRIYFIKNICSKTETIYHKCVTSTQVYYVHNKIDDFLGQSLFTLRSKILGCRDQRCKHEYLDSP